MASIHPSDRSESTKRHIEDMIGSVRQEDTRSMWSYERGRRDGDGDAYEG